MIWEKAFTTQMHTMCRLAVSFVLAAALALPVLVWPEQAQAQRLALLRDAEIESLMRVYLRDIFRAAGVDPRATQVHLVNADSINAFVADGQRIFIHTGLLTEADTPNQVIGVLAHETAHLANGDLAKLGIKIDKLSTAAILGTVLGMAAMVGGAVAGQGAAAQAGQGVMLGTQAATQRSLLAYARVQESSADQAAVRYLTATKQSAKGMLDLFEKLSTRSIASLRNADPYVMSHPLPRQRIARLERLAKKSPYYNKKDTPAEVLRFKLMQAKIHGYLNGPQMVYRLYPTSNNSLPARYARSISAFRRGDMQNSIRVIDTLLRDMPGNPYFWELKGDALLKGGNPQGAIAPLKKSVSMLPNNGLIRITLAQAYLGAGGKANAKAALDTLRQARRSENSQSFLHTLMARAYGQLGQITMANLETAEAAYRRGDRELALEKATLVRKRFKRGSPEWNQANDIIAFSKKKKK